MSSNVLTKNAVKAIFGTKRSTQSMNNTTSIVHYAVNQCVRFTQALGFNLKALDSTQPIPSSTTRPLTRAFVNVLWPSGTLTARALKGLRASLKGVACLIAAAIGIALSMPMAVAPAAQIMPIKTYAKAKTTNTKQWTCLAKLWGKESAWNHLADNPHSTAYGIPQILGLTTNNPYKQIDLGIKYIKHRYNTPCKAWTHHKNKGWY